MAKDFNGNPPMKILYIAQHNQANNDDEGSITAGLLGLGHRVYCFSPSNLSHDLPDLVELAKEHWDFVLFHKLPISYVNYICEKWRGVCWFFDPLRKGFTSNDNYIDLIEPWLYRGFFTDGDYVQEKNDPRIIDLKQGFDGISNTTQKIGETHTERDVLFIGTAGVPGYEKRTELLDTVVERYGEEAVHTRYSIFKDELLIQVRNTKIMLAMPPVTDHYWSNRVYLLGGRGACLVHPFSKGLFQEFGNCISFFFSSGDMIRVVDELLAKPSVRHNNALDLQKEVWKNHCYHHRVKELVDQL